MSHPDEGLEGTSKRRSSARSQELRDTPPAKRVRREDNSPLTSVPFFTLPRNPNAVPRILGGGREAVPDPNETSFSVTKPEIVNEASLEASKLESDRASKVQLSDGMKQEISIWCDGSIDYRAAKFGGLRGRVGGYSLVFWDHRAQMYQVLGWMNKQLSNSHDAELYAVRQSLDVAMRILKSTDPTYPPQQMTVKIFTDSYATLHMICTGTRNNVEATIQAIKDIHRYANAIGKMADGNTKVEFHWLKRKGSGEHKLADKFAYKAIKAGDFSFMVSQDLDSVVKTHGPLLPAIGRDADAAVGEDAAVEGEDGSANYVTEAQLETADTPAHPLIQEPESKNNAVEEDN